MLIEELNEQDIFMYYYKNSRGSSDNNGLYVAFVEEKLKTHIVVKDLISEKSESILTADQSFNIDFDENVTFQILKLVNFLDMFTDCRKEMPEFFI